MNDSNILKAYLDLRERDLEERILAGIVAALDASLLSATLARIEAKMATFQENLDRLEQTVNEFSEREMAEDADHALSKAEVERLTAEVADLQAQIDAGTITPEQQARFDALVQQITDSNRIPDEVLPE